MCVYNSCIFLCTQWLDISHESTSESLTTPSNFSPQASVAHCLPYPYPHVLDHVINIYNSILLKVLPVDRSVMLLRKLLLFSRRCLRSSVATLGLFGVITCIVTISGSLLISSSHSS